MKSLPEKKRSEQLSGINFGDDWGNGLGMVWGRFWNGFGSFSIWGKVWEEFGMLGMVGDGFKA